MNILDAIPVVLEREEAAQRLGLPSQGPRGELLDGALTRARELIQPRACFRTSYVYEKGEDTVKVGSVTFKSRILRVNLEKADKVFPYVITLGDGLDRAGEAAADMLQKYYLDQLGNLALGQAQEYLLTHLREKYGLGKVSRMNPGSLTDWPLEEQQQLFALLGPEEVRDSLGVSLTSSFLMRPMKSVSGIVFPTEKTFKSCQLCPREDCPGRQAPYNEKLLKDYS